MPADINDIWRVTLQREQSEFRAARDAFAKRQAIRVAEVRQLREALTRHLANVRTAHEQLREQIASAQLLERSMTASLGFWATIGILLAWAIRQSH